MDVFRKQVSYRSIHFVDGRFDLGNILPCDAVENVLTLAALKCSVHLRGELIGTRLAIGANDNNRIGASYKPPLAISTTVSVRDVFENVLLPICVRSMFH